MRSMFFKDLLIAEIKNHTARYLSFNKGLNIITGLENHVGKSSIMKTFYHTLGADVKFDDKWDKKSKLSRVTIEVDGKEYKVARFKNTFAIFEDDRVVFLTNRITDKLAPELARIFGLSIYLVDKNDKKMVLAPPAFSFMPYYIDQDKGWTDLYNSFERMNQFDKDERVKALLYHLGVYTKERVDIQLEIDNIKNQLNILQEEERRLAITNEALSDEMNNLVPANTETELKQNTKIINEEIKALVIECGGVRNKIQELCTTIQKHEEQLDIIKKYQRMQKQEEKTKKTVHFCPRCGCELDDDLYGIIRKNYNQSNSKYLQDQIELIINSIKIELKEQETKYIHLLSAIKEKQRVYDYFQQPKDVMLRHVGLSDTFQKYSMLLSKNNSEQDKCRKNIRKLENDKRKISENKDCEQIYIRYVQENLKSLHAWMQEYDGNIHLLKSLKAQGSLLPKIILSQYNAIFQTMDEMQTSVIRFPFIADSPREKESSHSSSKDILNMIVHISSLPQIILATVDYDSFEIDDGGNLNRIYLDKPFHVLNEDEYQDRKDEIESLYAILTIQELF